MKTENTPVKSLVTVHSVRAANGRMMSNSVGSSPSPAIPSHRVAAKIRDVATAGQVAMQSLKK